MSDTATHEQSSPARRRRDRWLWFCVLSGPVRYSVYFVAGYLFAEVTCTAGLLRYTIMGLQAISWWIVVMALLAAGVTGFSTVKAFTMWKEFAAADEPAGFDERYVAFMSFVGAWVSGLFTVVILVTGTPALFLVLCDWI